MRCSVYGTLSTLLRHQNSKACILLPISAERVRASHSYRAMDMTMALSIFFVLIEIDLLLSIGCNFANVDVAMATLDFISVSDLPSFVI